MFDSNMNGGAEWLLLVIFFLAPLVLILFVVKHRILGFLFVFSYIGVGLAILFDWAIEKWKRNNIR